MWDLTRSYISYTISPLTSVVIVSPQLPRRISPSQQLECRPGDSQLSCPLAAALGCLQHLEVLSGLCVGGCYLSVNVR